MKHRFSLNSDSFDYYEKIERKIILIIEIKQIPVHTIFLN